MLILNNYICFNNFRFNTWLFVVHGIFIILFILVSPWNFWEYILGQVSSSSKGFFFAFLYECVSYLEPKFSAILELLSTE